MQALRHPFVVFLLPLLLPGCGAAPSPEHAAPQVQTANVVIPPAKPAPDAQSTEEPESSQPPSAHRDFIYRNEDPSAAENVAIIEFCEKYRRAVEEMDAERLVSMASPDYHDDGGTTDTRDDIDRAELEAYLRTNFIQSKVIRYEMTYRRILREKGIIRVEYSYTASFQSADQRTTKTLADKNSLVLVPSEGSFLIRSGM